MIHRSLDSVVYPRVVSAHQSCTHSRHCPQVGKDIKCLSLLGSKKRKEHVERNLHSIDVRNTPLVRNKLEVNKVDHWPNLPGSLTGRQKVILDLASNDTQGVTVNQAKVGEEDTHEDWAPEELIDGNLCEDGGGVGSGDLFVEPVVEVMSGGAVVDESEEGEGGETLPVDGSTGDEELLCIH